MSASADQALLQAEVLIVKRDFDMLRQLVTIMPKAVNTLLIPNVAMLCYEALDYLKKRGYPVALEQSSRYSLKDIRQKAKFFNLSLSQLLQSVANVDKLQNDYYLSKLSFPWMGRLNWHFNLGIAYDEQLNVVGNTQYMYYIFQDDKSISRPPDSMSGHQMIGEEVRAFGTDMGKIIAGVSDGLRKVNDGMQATVIADRAKVYSQDFNTNLVPFVGQEEDKTVRLFLLHMLTGIGFMLFVFRKAIVRDTGLLMRFEYITYHYALYRLEKLLRFLRADRSAKHDEKLMAALSGLDFQNESGLRQSEFRNCMMHLSLTDKNGQPLVDGDRLCLSVPFCGLVESRFGMPYDRYRQRLEAELLRIHSVLQTYLDFKLSVEDSVL